MILELKRDKSNTVCTPGVLFIDGQFECFSLEDPVRDRKIFGRSAIPAGKYRVRLTYSPRFKKTMPLIEDVPGYSGIRIHIGNTAEDTEGCVLVGEVRRSPLFVGNSRTAYQKLFGKLEAANRREEEIWIQIINPPLEEEQEKAA